MSPNSGNGPPRAKPSYARSISRPDVKSTAIRKRQTKILDSGPQFEFITVSNPLEFGEDQVKSTVRSKAMKYFRKQETLEAQAKEHTKIETVNATTTAVSEQDIPTDALPLDETVRYHAHPVGYGNETFQFVSGSESFSNSSMVQNICPFHTSRSSYEPNIAGSNMSYTCGPHDMLAPMDVTMPVTSPQANSISNGLLRYI